MLFPFVAAYYSEKNRRKISELVVPNLDTAEHLWGARDSSQAFRNVLVGSPEQRGEIWQAWISNGEVSITDEAKFYVLRQTQDIYGKKIDRWALYAAIDIHEPKLFIHEDVLGEGVERARQSTEACESDMAPIFVGCNEFTGEKLRNFLMPYCEFLSPLIEYNDPDSSHKVWPISEGKLERELQGLFTNASLYVLDGHHRLAAAKENHRLGMGDGKILICICSMGENDTQILPIHRVVHYDRWMIFDTLQADLVRAGCKIEPMDHFNPNDFQHLMNKIPQDYPACIVQHAFSDRPYLITLPSHLKNQPQTLANLAVAALDYGVLELYPQATVIPVPSAALALEQIALDQAQVAFFLPPSNPSQVRAVAEAKLKMPRKSTRFVPKPALGLISRPWGCS